MFPPCRLAAADSLRHDEQIMVLFRSKPQTDTADLKRIGAKVRARLDADPAAYRIPVDDFEIYAVGEFFTHPEFERLVGVVGGKPRPSDT